MKGPEAPEGRRNIAGGFNPRSVAKNPIALKGRRCGIIKNRGIGGNMGSTLTKLLYHVVFSTKHRATLITDTIQAESGRIASDPRVYMHTSAGSSKVTGGTFSRSVALLIMYIS